MIRRALSAVTPDRGFALPCLPLPLPLPLTLPLPCLCPCLCPCLRLLLLRSGCCHAGLRTYIGDRWRNARGLGCRLSVARGTRLRITIQQRPAQQLGRKNRLDHVRDVLGCRLRGVGFPIGDGFP